MNFFEKNLALNFWMVVNSDWLNVTCWCRHWMWGKTSFRQARLFQMFSISMKSLNKTCRFHLFILKYLAFYFFWSGVWWLLMEVSLFLSLCSPPLVVSPPLGKSNLQFAGMTIGLTVSTSSLNLLAVDCKQVRRHTCTQTWIKCILSCVKFTVTRSQWWKRPALCRRSSQQDGID